MSKEAKESQQEDAEAVNVTRENKTQLQRKSGGQPGQEQVAALQPNLASVGSEKELELSKRNTTGSKQALVSVKN